MIIKKEDLKLPKNVSRFKNYNALDITVHKNR